MWKLITERFDESGIKRVVRLCFENIDDVRSFVDFCITNINDSVNFVLEREDVSFD